MIELKKLEEASEIEKEEKQELYRWARLIAAKSWEVVCMEAKGNPYMEKVKEEMDKINQDKTERWLYLRREMAVSDERSRLLTAERRGEARGEAKGEKYFAELTKRLLEDARLDDLKRAVEDAIFREALYKEYGLRDERN